MAARSGSVTIDVPEGTKQVVLLNPQEVCDRYQRNGFLVDIADVREAIKRKRLPSFQLGWNYLIPAHELPAEFPFPM